MRPFVRRAVVALVTALPAAAPTSVATEPKAGTYREEIDAWRVKREASLKADGGWLTVAGLFWLKEGDNRFGSDPRNEIVLPPSAPARAGVITFAAGRATVRVEPGVAVTTAGRPVDVAELQPDTSGSPNVLSLGPLTLHLIKRGNRFGMRLKDRDSELRKSFAGLAWFPVGDGYRVTAAFVSYPPLSLSDPGPGARTGRRFSAGRRAGTLDGRRTA